MNPHLLPLALACGLTFLAFLGAVALGVEFDPGSKFGEGVLMVMFAGAVLSAVGAVGSVLTAAWQAAL